MARSSLAILAGLALAVATPAFAQAPDEPGSVLVEELTVLGRPPGPPIWKVKKGDAELFVVGAVGPIHHQQAWDSRRLQRLLDGADRLLAPPEAQVGPLQALRFLAGDLWRVRLGSGPRLEARLPTPLRDRFVRYRSASDLKASRYEDWKPAVAGFLLLSDVRQAGGLSEAKPGSTIRRLAEARRVKVRPLAQYRLQPLVAAAGSLSDADHLACLEEVLDQLDRETGAPRELGDAWAEGDLAAVRRLQRASALDRCLHRSAKGRRVLDAQIGTAAEALADALERPGRTVALVDLAYVLPLEGVLDRLKASGAEVSVPPE